MQPGSVHVQTFYLQTGQAYQETWPPSEKVSLKIGLEIIKYAWKPPKVIYFTLVESLWDLQGWRQPWSGESWLAVLCEVNLSRSDVCDEKFSARVQDEVQNEKRAAKRLTSKSTWEPAFTQHVSISSFILLCWEGSAGPRLVNRPSVHLVRKNCSGFFTSFYSQTQVVLQTQSCLLCK